MPSLKRHDGELMIDHRASPGLPEDFYRPLGIDAPAIGGGRLFETATITCSHCNGVVVLNPLRTRERAYCSKCDHYICDSCKAASCLPLYSHAPFEKIVDVVTGSDKQYELPALLAQLKGN
jgi:hypothetical protein